MSISCYKNYSVVINPALTSPQEYWTLDSLVGGKYVGSIAGTQITPNSVSSVSGVINNGIESSVGGGGGTASGIAALAKGAIGQSLSCWIKAITVTSALPNDGLDVFVGWSGGGIIGVGGLATGGAPPTVFQGAYHTPTENIPNVTQNMVMGNWEFGVVTYNSSTKVMAFYRNGSFVGSNTGISNAGTSVDGYILISGVNHTGDDFLCDEVGYWGNHVLTAGEVAALYNGGAGARPPGV